MIKKCNCHNSFQDEKYGQGMRVHNRCKHTASGTPYRCTVCLDKKMGDKEPEKKK